MTETRRIVLKQETIRLGFGATARTTVIENYYQVGETGEGGQVALRLLDINDEPFGPPEVMSRERLEQEYIACPDYLSRQKNCQEVLVEKHVRNGEAHYEKREFHSAVSEFNKALSLNGDHLRAHLGKGKTLFARGDREEAQRVFEHLGRIETLYERENKHVFNEFGIELRKRKLLKEAIANYAKAIAIDPEDAVIFYNLGRAYYEQGEQGQAAQYLHRALTLQPDFREAREFLASLG
ncbi:MAG: tetratricopeptide repeat protein [Desulfobacterota bacterium]|jgi:tetratricopeptide (TPR) repeat protein|nr:tetratricopeptide repeat protein [Thermodesulfobacteriota bacterium]